MLAQNQPGTFMSERPFSSPEEELAFLKKKIAEREAHHDSEQVFHREDETKRVPPPPHIEQDVIKEYVDVPPSVAVEEPLQHSIQERQEILLDLSPEDHDSTMLELQKVLEEKGIHAALKLVESMESPHLEDDFHRFLVGHIRNNLPIVGLKEKTPLAKDLKHTLYQISLPEFNEQEKQKPLAEFVGTMTQLLAGMTSLSKNKKIKKQDETFTLEIAQEENGSEYVFYISVPKQFKDLFEKQLLAVYPQARLEEKKDDFNVFNPEGETVGAYAKLAHHPALSLKTFQDLSYDPMNIVLNAFSKLKSLGEGAAIQIVCNPVGQEYVSDYQNKLHKIQEGDDPKEVLAQRGLFMKMATEFVGALKDKKDDNNKPPVIDQTIVEAMNEKIQSSIVETNIRITASAYTENHAADLVSELESGFRQFEKATGNSLQFERVSKSEKRQFIRDFSFRSFNKKYIVPLSLNELASLYHFPLNITPVTSQAKQSKGKSVAAPVNIAQEGITLGNNEHQGQSTPISYSAEDRLRHFYVIGQTGTGKTTILKNMIYQDIQNGEGVCFIDPHGSDVQDILSYVPEHRRDDVIYFDPASTDRPMAFNMLEYDERYPEQKTFVVNEMMGIFNKLFDMKSSGGPMFEQYFRNATMLVIDDPATGSTLLDISRVLADKEYRELKLSRCKNPLIVQFWTEIAGKAGGEGSLENIVPYITSKFDVFLSNDIMRPIVSQQKSSFSFRDVMDNKKILLVNLSKGRLGDINASLLGLVIVGKFLMAALSRADSFGKDFPPFYLYVDEFQNFTTDSISQILSEARKYKLSLNLAHQFISQLDDDIKQAVFGNVGSMAICRVGQEDAEFLAKQFEPTFSASDITQIENYNSVVKMLSHGQPVTPFSMKGIYREPGDLQAAEDLKKLSAMKFGRPRHEVEEEIMRRFKG